LTSKICLLVFAAALCTAVVSQQAQETCSDSSTIKLGEKLRGAPTVGLADAIAAPRLFSGRVLRVDGFIDRRCVDQTCWFELTSKTGVHGVRVEFKEGAYTIPVDARGMRTSAEGRFQVQKLSASEADHAKAIGERVQRDGDGSAFKVVFVLEGIELKSVESSTKIKP
jgi:uncharacterized protein DUF4920